MMTCVMTLEKGVAYATSTRQNLNTRSSTEAELVAVNEIMPQILWSRNFLMYQGIDVQENLIYQDNKSAILMENNGRGSSSKRTRHINIRYFFVKDIIEKGEVRVQYCNTENMIADFLQSLDKELYLHNTATI
jgi:hypothetical protein